MSKVRLGFLGVGRMGQMAHLVNYTSIDDCEVVAVADALEETGRLVARRYGIPAVYTDYRDMLAKEDLDGVVAIQQFQHHWGILPDVYKAVKYVMTEKPLAVSVKGGEELVAAAAAAGCTHMVGYHKRSDPATRYVVDLLEAWKKSGEMGALKYVRILMPGGDWVASGMTGVLHAGDQASATAANKTESVAWVGPTEEDRKRLWEFVNYYIHQVNLMRCLLGNESYRPVFGDPSGVVLVAQSESGVPGVIEMSPYTTRVEWEEEALIAFEKAYIKLRLFAPLTVNRAGEVEIYTDPGAPGCPRHTRPTLPWVHAMRQQAENFVKVCRGEMDPPCTAAEALEDLKVAVEYRRLIGG